MRLTTISCLVAALSSASSVLAAQSPTASPTRDDSPYVTPAPELVEDAPNLELRQNPAFAPDVTQAPGQMPPVTMYTIATQVGLTAVQTEIVYTQLFSPVPDQFPSPKPGVIGYGTLQHKKREAEAVNTVQMVQPVIFVMETAIVTQPLQRVTEVLVIETVDVRNITAANATTLASGGTRPASLNTQAYAPMYTASS